MFDFAWSEIVLIGVVALIAIGPKELPGAMKAVAGMVKKARRMAGEFQTHVDEMMREADLHEVREQINEIRNFDIRGEVEKSVDPDGSLRSTFSSNPLEPELSSMATQAPSAAVSAATATGADEAGDLPVNYVLERPPHPIPESSEPAPDFVPPAAVPTAVPAAAEAEDVPAFIPPGVHRA
jgi:sec-independent protein translocase protein TatB